jgi:hypothetical protein
MTLKCSIASVIFIGSAGAGSTAVVASAGGGGAGGSAVGVAAGAQDPKSMLEIRSSAAKTKDFWGFITSSLAIH